MKISLVTTCFAVGALVGLNMAFAQDIEGQASGDIVSIPEYQLGLPDGELKMTPGMITSGLGGSQDVGNIIENLQAALDADENKLDLMHWYLAPLSEGQEVHYCTSNSFRCDYDPQAKGPNGEKKNRVAVAMAVWLPQDARHINVSFSSQSAGLSLAVYTYDYLTGTVVEHYSENNIFSNPHAPGTVVTHEDTIASKHGAFTGNYLILMFNTSSSEKDWLDINGLGVSYAPLVVSDEFDINPFNDDVGINIVNYSIPEPATATLGLLALAGLAARRRRR